MKESKIFRHIMRIFVFAALVIMDLEAVAQDLSTFPVSRARFKNSVRTLAKEKLNGNVTEVWTGFYNSYGDRIWEQRDYYTNDGKRYYSLGGDGPENVNWVELSDYDKKGRLTGYYVYSYANEGGIEGYFAVAKYDDRDNIVELTYYQNYKERNGVLECIYPKASSREYVSSLFRNIDHDMMIKLTYHYNSNGNLLKVDAEGPDADMYDQDYDNGLSEEDSGVSSELESDCVYDKYGNWTACGLIKDHGDIKIYRKKRHIMYK